MVFWLFEINWFSVTQSITVCVFLLHGCFNWIDFPDALEQIAR